MSRSHRVPIVLAAALLLGAAASTQLAAQGWIEPWRGGGQVVRLRSSVTATVSGRVARVEVEELFQNRGPTLAEGEYHYALPGEAAFADLSLWQGERELKGEMLDAERARGIYEEIVRRRRDPALVELIGHGLLRARVFPIAPGDTRKVTIRFTQVLPRAGDAVVFRYAAGRLVPGVPGVVQRPWRPFPLPGPQPRVAPERPAPVPSPGDAAPITLRLVVEDGAAFRDAFSPTHDLRTEREGRRMTVRPTGELHGDVAVFLPLVQGIAGVSVAAYRAGEEDGYAMITLSPGDGREEAVPRDVTFVLDVSGSMSGDKIDQARRAIRNLLGSLSPGDRFRLIAFNSGVDPYRSDWTTASAPELATARRWVDGLQASGSTDIAGALAEAFRQESPASRLPIVVFVTDGLPTAGEQDPDRIAARAETSRGRARVFAFGVGYDVNTRLLDQLSQAARGATAYVEPGEDLERPLAVLATKIRHPVLTEMRLAGAPVELRDVYPAPLPDLFAGDELVVLARYRGAATGELAFTGRRAGAVERLAVVGSFPAQSRQDDYIPRLWASRKIGALTRELRLHGRNPELEAEVKQLGLRYGILTDFTAYLVQEPGFDVAQAAAVPAAFMATGQSAVRSAEVARVHREAKSLSSLAAADAAFTGNGAAAGPAASTSWRVVAGRRFTLRDGVWADGLSRAGARTVAVQAFSPAYFALIRALPELREWCTAFPRLELSGVRVTLKLGEAGAGEAAALDLERLVREFRGL